jgi:2-succinyl-5-enolpyruvyl-6-hydroxy-3-cyclohexene-1-carboxylate synthase
MYHLQHISDLGSIFAATGARHIIIAPGSRNAPLIQLFTSDGQFRCHSIVDERSAGYVALGMARQLGEPVVLVTTSGTAVLNLSPAVAEAFHQRIPLLVVTADRPVEILSQFNNQVTDQRAPYFNYSKGFFEFPTEVRTPSELDAGMRSVQQLFREAVRFPEGPVHLNLPLTEPLYNPLPVPNYQLNAGESGHDEPLNGSVSFPEIDPETTRVMILAGMGNGEEGVHRILSKILSHSQSVVVAENISNLFSDLFVASPELVLSGATENELLELVPEVVIAFGLQVVSKRIRLFVQSLENARLVELPGGDALDELLDEALLRRTITNRYQQKWKEIEKREMVRSTGFLQQAPFANLTAVWRILERVPTRTVIHLGNSATIRISQLMGARADLRYYSNRGISGIDGSLSSAVGAAMVSDRQHLLLLGDLSFVYDSNGLWNKDFPDNLKIIVLNDGGGGIFRLLDGPDRMRFFEEFSVTQHPVSLELLSGAFGRAFGRAADLEELDRSLETLFAPGTGLSVIEVDTTASENSLIFRQLFK